MHPDGIETGTAALMEGNVTKSIKFADVNMLKHGDMAEAPVFYTNQTNVKLAGELAGLGDEWGQSYNATTMEWTLWNYCNAGKVNNWKDGLWHTHIWQYNPVRKTWLAFHDDATFGGATVGMTMAALGALFFTLF